MRGARRAARRSLPFSLAYLFDDGRDDGPARREHRRSPATTRPRPRVDRGRPTRPAWPAGLALAGETVLVDDLATRFADLPTGAWDVPPTRRSWSRSLQPRQAPPYGFLVLALNRYRPLDDGYRGFVDLVAGQIAASHHRRPRLRVRAARGRRRLAELDQAKTDFFTNVSHEFRTPLTLLLGPAEDALNDDADPVTGHQRDRVEVILRNGQRLLKLVNTLLDFSRLESGRAEARFEPVDLAQLHPRAGAACSRPPPTGWACASPSTARRCPSRCTSTATCGPRSSSTCSRTR